MQDGVDAQFAAPAGDGSGEQGGAGGDENLVLDGGSVDVGVRPDEYRVAEVCGVACAAADEGVLHDDVGTEPDLAVLGGEYGAMEDAGAFAEDDRPAQGGRGCDGGGAGDHGRSAAVFQDHVWSDYEPSGQAVG